MGYGNVAPAPVRSTDCAETTPPERSAAAEMATAMLRTVFITCDSVRGSLSRYKTLSAASRTVTPQVKGLSRLSRGCSVGEKDSDGGADAHHALGPDATTRGRNEMPYDCLLYTSD